MRHTKSKTRRRRANTALYGSAITKTDGVPHLRHRASAVTGTYRGRQVMNVKGKLAKKKASKSE